MDMEYISTRGALGVSAAEAIAAGLAPDGGLYVPSRIPAFTEDELRLLAGGSYAESARMVLAKYLDGFTAAEIAECVSGAYGGGAFRCSDVAALRELEGGPRVMELFWGPTCAFKDVALQIMPRLLVMSARKLGVSERIAVVVATSGDTGKAALEGFCDVEGTSVTVVYPDGGVSELQRRQMATQRGGNTRVIALEGNFDDAQSAVKRLFSDGDARKKLLARGVRLSSANSINWGRLLPQIVYYAVFSARLSGGGPVDFVVPTGNFGNILAAYYARRMGAPVGRLTIACNRNDVLADFLETGVYNRVRPFYRTISPSMDILVSSNLERLLFELSGRDALAVAQYMRSLAADGSYTARGDIMDGMRAVFSCSRCPDSLARETIARCWEDFGYLADPHTAAALSAALARPDGGLRAVAAATASPFKFPAAVYASLFGRDALGGHDDYEALALLASACGREVPPPLANLASLPEGRAERCTPDALVGLLADTL